MPNILCEGSCSSCLSANENMNNWGWFTRVGNVPLGVKLMTYLFILVGGHVDL